MSTTTTYPYPVHLDDLHDAYQGSYLTIPGTGGDLQEWVDGLNAFLEDQGCGHPAQWFTVTGAEVNAYAGNVPDPRDRFLDDLGFMLAPLDDMNVGRLALVRLMMPDARWFDDIVDNMRPAPEPGEDEE